MESMNSYHTLNSYRFNRKNPAATRFLIVIQLVQLLTTGQGILYDNSINNPEGGLTGVGGTVWLMVREHKWR